MLRKTTPTKTKYKDLFPSFLSICFPNVCWYSTVQEISVCLLLIHFQDAESKRKELEEREKKLAKRQEEINMREKVSAAD
jgi:uncharacterized protein (DUF2225 family)